jgi:HAD superfamily hydrolase (TIGR01450 family)
MTHPFMEGVDGVVCDLDGVIYRGNEVIPGAPSAVERLRERGIRVLFCTNNSRSTVAQYIRRLDGFGIQTGEDDLLTSAVVMGEVLAERGYGGKAAVVVGGDGVHEALERAEVRTVDGSAADLVVVGWDPSFDFDALTRATVAVIDGATLIATNDDASFPSPRGLLPGAGALLASIETASATRAEVLGKPNAPMMDAVEKRLAGCRNIAIVGDRAETDLEGGRSKGWRTALVLSGVTGAVEAKELRPAPDAIIESLSGLVD